MAIDSFCQDQESIGIGMIVSNVMEDYISEFVNMEKLYKKVIDFALHVSLTRFQHGNR